MEACIHGYLAAQKELYEARDLLEKAMMVMPGAAGFLNRQTMVSRGIGSSTGLLCRPSRSLSVSLDSSTHTVRGLCGITLVLILISLLCNRGRNIS